jgi:hypothetical protein
MSIDWAQGKLAMKTKKYRDKYMHTIATSMRLSESWHGSSRLFGGDSWFAGVKNAIAHRKHGLHFIGDVKGGTAFYPKKMLTDWTPATHGECIIYETKIDDQVLYAIGVRRGFMKVRHLITTCCTTLPAEEQTYVDWGPDGDKRVVVRHKRVHADFIWSSMQPATDVHNKIRQKGLAVEKVNRFS